jgi:hypothetical protein
MVMTVMRKMMRKRNKGVTTILVNLLSESLPSLATEVQWIIVRQEWQI